MRDLHAIILTALLMFAVVEVLVGYVYPLTLGCAKKGGILVQRGIGFACEPPEAIKPPRHGIIPQGY